LTLQKGREGERERKKARERERERERESWKIPLVSWLSVFLNAPLYAISS